jgi:cellulose synthase/poly-beta-1,6-N-acetylglucosamine synthase-like glycosyltransferase
MTQSNSPTSRVSLVATCLDERDQIEAWWQSVIAQTRPPDEIVIVDGGSTDGTVERLLALSEEAPAARVFLAPGANIPAGRNIAIREARGELIAVTDVGTVLDQEWLERLLEPFSESPPADVSGGFFRPAGTRSFQRVLAAVITPALHEIRGEDFLPSSRSVALRKEWWERVGGYPQWLPWSEDVVFDLDLRAAGARFAFCPDAIVSWHPPARPTGFLRQYQRYARGDGRAGLWPDRHAIRFAFYVVLVRLLARGGTASRAIAFSLLNAYLRRFVRRVHHVRPADSAPGMAAAYLAVPAIVVGGDMAKLTGYAWGTLERLRARGRSGLAGREIPYAPAGEEPG